MESKKKAASKKGGKKEEENEPVKKGQRRIENTEVAELPPPKKPKSAYITFSMDKRADILKKNPDLKGKEVMKQLGRLWNQLAESDKKYYMDLQVKDKARYERQLKEFKTSGKYYDDRGELVRPQQTSKNEGSAPVPAGKRKPSSKPKK